MNPSDMNNEQLRIAVAERLGWTSIRPNDDAVCAIENIGCGFRGTFKGIEGEILPNWPEDLNACHEMEKALDDGGLWHGYLNCLWDVVCPQFNQMNGLNTAVGLLLVHASARQRCLAFLAATKGEKQ